MMYLIKYTLTVWLSVKDCTRKLHNNKAKAISAKLLELNLKNKLE